MKIQMHLNYPTAKSCEKLRKEVYEEKLINLAEKFTHEFSDLLIELHEESGISEICKVLKGTSATVKMDFEGGEKKMDKRKFIDNLFIVEGIVGTIAMVFAIVYFLGGMLL